MLQTNGVSAPNFKGEIMQGDTIIIEEHHRRAAREIVPLILPLIEAAAGKYTLTVAGQSGSGKSETAEAIAEELQKHGLETLIFQQDDYFVYPPKSNDAARREDIRWVGPQEVNLSLLDRHLKDFLEGQKTLIKPLVDYAANVISTEQVDMDKQRIAIAEGTYTTLLENAGTRIYIARNYEQTRAHRLRRNRDASELDEFTDGVLKIEHEIISAHRKRADIIIEPDYSVHSADKE